MDLAKFDAEELIALSQVDMDNNRVDSALEKIKFALTLDNCPAIANAIAAKIYAQLKLFEKAKPLYQSFLEQYPNALTEKFQYGMIHLESADQESAIDIWQHILEAEPTHPPTLYYSAIANLELNHRDEAERHLKVLLQSAPSDNLYFSKGKELLENLSTQLPETPPKSDLYQ